MTTTSRRWGARAVGLSSVLILMSSLLGSVTTAAATAPIRPDGRVRLVGESTWLGNNVYNTTGARQTRAVQVAPGTTRKFEVSLQNDGRVDSFKVKGTASSPSIAIAYRYKGRSVTNAVVAGTFALNRVATRATRTLTVRMTARASAPGGAYRATVRFTSKASPVKKDVVRTGLDVVVASPNLAPAFPDPIQVSTTDSFQYDPNTGQLVGVTTDITVSACVDPDGDPLTYQWSATNGSIVGTSNSARWTRVIQYGWPADGDVTVTCRDPGGLSDSHILQFR